MSKRAAKNIMLVATKMINNNFGKVLKGDERSYLFSLTVSFPFASITNDFKTELDHEFKFIELIPNDNNEVARDHESVVIDDSLYYVAPLSWKEKEQSFLRYKNHMRTGFYKQEREKFLKHKAEEEGAVS